jgi:hypothetical protein
MVGYEGNTKWREIYGSTGRDFFFCGKTGRDLEVHTDANLVGCLVVDGDLLILLLRDHGRH